MYRKILAVAALATVAFAAAAEARDQIRIVGSSTVYPFATAVAERFGKASGFRAPVVESTGSGGGIKLFCNGVGVDAPDITNSSRRIKKSEIESCARNGVTEITEVKIGFDGIVLANSKAAPQMKISIQQIWLALAKQVPEGNEDGGKLVPNPNRTWRDIDPPLPAARIEVLGPPPTSGTRDAFVELVMEAGCDSFPSLKAMAKTDANAHKAVCLTVREDGGWIDAGENDNLIVQKLQANKSAFGVFGFSFLDQNTDKLQGSMVDGSAPTFENIASGAYPVSRSMYFYVKKAHVGSIPGIKEYIAEFTSEKAWGPRGYLADKGLIPLPEEERKKVREQALSLADLTM